MEHSDETAVRKGIYYALVARGSTVLAEFSAVPSHAQAIARQILDKMPAAISEGNSYVSYAHDHYIYHVKKSSDAGLTVLCMADDGAGRMIPYAFLNDIHGTFLKNYGNRDLPRALAYAMNEEFSRELSQQMDYYSKNPSANRINRMLGQLGEVRQEILDNIEKILERGEKLEVLIHKTACIQDKSFKFALSKLAVGKTDSGGEELKSPQGFVLTTLTISLIVMMFF